MKLEAFIHERRTYLDAGNRNDDRSLLLSQWCGLEPARPPWATSTSAASGPHVPTVSFGKALGGLVFHPSRTGINSDHAAST